MTARLLTGAAAGLGLMLVVRGFAPPVPRLARALGSGVGWRASGRGSLVVVLVESVGVDLGRRRSDLAVTGKSAEQYAVEKVTAALVFALLPAAGSALLAAGGLTVPGGYALAAMVACTAIGFVIPDLVLRSEAQRRRREFRHGLGAYLDLVAIVVAGGGGTETALYAAVEVGSGWVFADLARTLAACRLVSESPWSALDRLGADLGVTELREIAASVGLAGEHGAKVRESLAVRAASMREHRISEVEAESQAATEKMSIPVVLMLFGFVAFVLYPALQLVMGPS